MLVSSYPDCHSVLHDLKTSTYRDSDEGDITCMMLKITIMQIETKHFYHVARTAKPMPSDRKLQVDKSRSQLRQTCATKIHPALSPRYKFIVRDEMKVHHHHPQH